MNLDTIRDDLIKIEKSVSAAKMDKSKLEGRLQSVKEKLTELEIDDVNEAKRVIEKYKEQMEENEKKLIDGYNKLKQQMERN